MALETVAEPILGCGSVSDDGVYCRGESRSVRRRRISRIATYISNRFIPTPASVGSQARCATPFTMPMGRHTAKTPIHTLFLQIPRRMPLRALSSRTTTGSALDETVFLAICFRTIASRSRAEGPKIAISATNFENVFLFATDSSHDTFCYRNPRIPG